MLEILLSLAKVGFHGVAVAFVYLGYKLIKATKDISSDKYDQQCKQARFFLTIALAFLIIGAVLQIASGLIDPKNEIHLNFYPKEPLLGNQPDISLRSDTFKLDKGKIKFEVKDQESIGVSLEKLINSYVKKIENINEITLLRRGTISVPIGEDND